MEQIKEILNLLKEDTVTPKELKEFLTMVLTVIKKSKDNFDLTSKENLGIVKEALEYIESKHKKTLEIVSRETSSQKEEFEANIEQLKAIAEQVQAMKPKDADEEKIVEDVLSKIKLPEYEVFSLEEKGEEIVKEINSLEIKPQLQIDAKHIKNLPEFRNGVGGGVKFLQYLQDVNIQIPADGQVLTYDTTNNTWRNENASGGGTWGSITGTLSAQTDLQSALDAKQATLVSGTNIKTINGATLLGSGDIVIDATVTLADLSANSTTTPTSLYAMSSTIPVEFKTSDAHTLLYLDETNERIGIGTASPTFPLTVQTSSGNGFNVTNSTNNIGFYISGTTSNFGNISDHPLSINTNDTARVYIEAAGNIGIGTSTPSHLLNLSGSSNRLLQIVSTGSQSATSGGGIGLFLNSGAAMTTGSRLGAFVFGGATDASSTLANAAVVGAFAEENWSGSAFGSYINFETTINGTTTRAEKWRITGAGDFLAFTDNSFDIGASGATRPRTGYFGTSLVAPTINATTALQVGGANINTGGTLSNVAYLNVGNTFVQKQTVSFSGAGQNVVQWENTSATGYGPYMTAGDSTHYSFYVADRLGNLQFYTQNQVLISPTLNGTSAIQLNGTSINTAGTLSNVAYLNQANTFTANTQNFSGSVNSNATFEFKNLDTGASANTLLRVWNGTNDSMVFRSYSATHATNPNEAELDANRAGGLTMMASQASGAIRFKTGGSTTRMIIDSAGLVGIGKTPSVKLDVTTATVGNYVASFENTDADGHGLYVKANNSDNNRGTLVLENNTTQFFYARNDGYVGIGVTASSISAQLHTTGTVRFAGAGTPGAGKVLTSDADGDATWETPSGGSSGWALRSYSTATAASITVSSLNLTTDNNHYRVIVDMNFSTVSDRAVLRAQINGVSTSDTYGTVGQGRSIDWSAATGTARTVNYVGAQWQFGGVGGDSGHLVMDLYVTKDASGNARITGTYNHVSNFQDVGVEDFSNYEGAVFQNSQTNVTSMTFFNDSGSQNKVWRVWVLYPAVA